MKVFVVHKEGVYRHECCGVFKTQDSAIDVAVLAWLFENDMYHSFVVRSYEISEWHRDDGVLICRIRGNDQTSPHDAPSRDVMEVKYADNKETQ